MGKTIGLFLQPSQQFGRLRTVLNTFVAGIHHSEKCMIRCACIWHPSIVDAKCLLTGGPAGVGADSIERWTIWTWLRGAALTDRPRREAAGGSPPTLHLSPRFSSRVGAISKRACTVPTKACHLAFVLHFA